jgi:DNA polymerase-3 subunit delta
MVTALTGENTFGLQAELQRLTAAFVAEHGDLALERIDGEEVELSRIVEALTSLPFLSSKKLIVLRAPSKNKSFQEKFEQLLAEIPETTDVILVEPKLDKRSSYYKFLKKQPGFQDFPELDQANLANWLVTETSARGGKLSTADARLLVERVGASQQRLGNELEKLLLHDPQVSRASIELLTDEAPQSTIFQLLEAAFAGNRKRTMELYAQQRTLKVEPAQIIAMLAWQLHVVAIIKTAGERPANQIARDARLNPFVVQKSQSIARKLSLTELKKLISSLLDIDAKSKRTNLDTDEALQLYLLQLAS